jgi:hypothetical protein
MHFTAFQWDFRSSTTKPGSTTAGPRQHNGSTTAAPRQHHGSTMQYSPNQSIHLIHESRHPLIQVPVAILADDH